MSTFTSEPGTRLGGRYRLEDRLAAATGWSAWKAIDEILARPVSVITFAAGFPRLERVVTAARAASRLTDTRLTQVFDVEDSWEHAYIVLEWPFGETLADLLETGSLEPLAGARIVAEVAAALSGAHAAGLAHLCLRPDTVRWTAGGGVKVTGLGIDAALSGIGAEDPELADTRGLGELLYAALTGMWPGPDYQELPPAPTSEGIPRRPRQVLAGVPTFLDEVACRALGLPGRDDQPAFSSPAQVASALTAAIPPVRVPPAAASRDQRRDADRYSTQPGQSRQRQGPDGGYQQDRPARRRSVGRLVAISLLVLVAVVGASAAAVRLLDRSPSATGAGSKTSTSSSASPSGQVTVITPVSAHGFDALNPTGDPGDENSNLAENVLNGNPAGWSTQYYDSAHFGDLKPGTGLILNMGRAVTVSSVTVTFGNGAGADVQIKEGDSDVRSSANLYSMTTVAKANDVAGIWTFTVQRKVTDQYIVIWFTKLPPMVKGHGKYEAQIFSVVVHGTD
jgi:serine/threonine protein kinase